MIVQTLLYLIVFTVFFSPLQAQEAPSVFQIKSRPALSLPLECTPGSDCWVLNYMDMQADDGASTDPACGARTYDGHKGTDFALRDEAAMEKGVAVLAAADGKIIRVRDGEEDRRANKEALDSLRAERKECGNAVMIDHGDGLQSVYCHLKNKSVRVAQGDKVKEGDKIGEVGLSGYTQFPHLHFGVMQDNKIIDPFTGADNTQKCGGHKKTLWEKNSNLAYAPFVIYAAGFSDQIPSLEKIDREAKGEESLMRDADFLSFWVAAYGLEQGDKILLTITAPDGNVLAQRAVTQEQQRARQFYYIGKRKNDHSLAQGTYIGEAVITRGDQTQSIHKSVQVTP